MRFMAGAIKPVACVAAKRRLAAADTALVGRHPNVQRRLRSVRVFTVFGMNCGQSMNWVWAAKALGVGVDLLWRPRVVSGISPVPIQQSGTWIGG